MGSSGRFRAPNGLKSDVLRGVDGDVDGDGDGDVVGGYRRSFVNIATTLFNS